MDADLTETERQCCHLMAWLWSGEPLEDARREFYAVERSEHCRDCPALSGKEK